jgi:Protein of unknown function (DUF2950)
LVAKILIVQGLGSHARNEPLREDIVHSASRVFAVVGIALLLLLMQAAVAQQPAVPQQPVTAQQPEGTVYQKDRGLQTAALASAINTFDPDPSWQKAQP